MISLSYSRISLVDIAMKLQLDSPQDAEYIIAKAVRDGVIEASLDHHDGYMQSKVMLHIGHCFTHTHTHIDTHVHACVDRQSLIHTHTFPTGKHRHLLN